MVRWPTLIYFSFPRNIIFIVLHEFSLHIEVFALLSKRTVPILIEILHSSDLLRNILFRSWRCAVRSSIRCCFLCWLGIITECCGLLCCCIIIRYFYCQCLTIEKRRILILSLLRIAVIENHRETVFIIVAARFVYHLLRCRFQVFCKF